MQDVQFADAPADQFLPGTEAAGRRESAEEAHARVQMKDRREQAKSKRGVEKAGRRAGMPVRATSFSVPASLSTRWGKKARTDDATKVDVMLTAIAAQRDRLSDLVAERKRAAAPSISPTADGTFLQAVAPTSNDPVVTVTLRMLSANVDIIDALVHEAGADSRSALVVAALESWLEQPPG